MRHESMANERTKEKMEKKWKKLTDPSVSAIGSAASDYCVMIACVCAQLCPCPSQCSFENAQLIVLRTLLGNSGAST